MRRKDKEIKDIKTIINTLDICKTVSLAMMDDNMPYVVPLSYGYEMKDNHLILYFHCAREGRKLDILHRNNTVCFTIFREGELLLGEIPCKSSYYYSSIIGNGEVEFVEQSDEKTYALSKIFEQQSGRKVEFTKEQANSVCVFKIIVKDYTGKQKNKI